MKSHITFRFDGQAAVVTGGMRGIGRGIASILAKSGAEVYIFDRANDVEVPEGCTLFPVDVSSSASVLETVEKLPSKPVLLVNNAGITRDKSLIKMTDEMWQAVLNVNLTGGFHTIRALAPGMADAGYGRIVNIASINGLRGKFGQANYSASKGGLIALTKTAARELGPKGITVNAVAPGMVLTEMTLAIPEKFRQIAADESMLKKLPTVEDIANTVLFLLSDGARMITGEVIKVDSGQYI